MAKAKKGKQLSPKEAEEYRAEWNVPDWRNSKQYEHVPSLEDNQLRWEFLRRDKKYRTDWAKGKPYGYMEYELRAWRNPAEIGSPEFIQTCRLVDFSERDKTKRYLHYAALADSKLFGHFIFMVDGNLPLKPQLAYITEVHEAYAKNALSPAERRKRDKRKNNKNGRSPELLLRVLDADNEHVDIEKLAYEFGGEDGITDSAMRRTVAFAKGYWRRF